MTGVCSSVPGLGQMAGVRSTRAGETAPASSYIRAFRHTRSASTLAPALTDNIIPTTNKARKATMTRLSGEAGTVPSWRGTSSAVGLTRATAMAA